MAIDKLVVEITGDATGLTKALSSAQKNLTTFNTKIVEGNRAVNGFIGSLNKSAASFERLSVATSALKTNFTGLSRSITSSSTSVVKFGAVAKTAASDVKSFSTALTRIASSFERLGGASKSATAAINSLQRRVTALSATVSATNTSMRSFNRTVTMATSGAAKGGVIVNNYGSSIGRAGATANQSAGLFNRLNKANISLAEGFRRHVAQLTALRTLTYQAIFWFSPLIYSIVKVNAKYEQQMQLLKNLSGMQTEAAKTAYAMQTRMQLVKLAQTNPFSLDQITETFVRMKVTGLDPLNGGMQTLMDSIAAFGGSNDELERAGIALQQMVGKSAVSMEELRQQLGEHVPDAMKSMAEGMGLSMAEFYKQVQKGTVESKDAINKMLVVLALNHVNAANSMMNTWNGLMARMNTAWQNFVAKIEHSDGGNTFIDTLKTKVQELITFLNTPAGVNFAISVEHSLAMVVSGFTSLIKLIYQFRDEIVSAAKLFAAIWGTRLVIGTIVSLIGSFKSLISVLNAVIVVLRVLKGTTTAAAGASLIFGRNTANAAAATRVLTSVSAGATGSIGSLAASLGRGAIAAGLLAGSIWAVTDALKAKNAAQRQSDLIQSAKEGGVFEKPSDRKKALADLNVMREKRSMGVYFDASGGPLSLPSFHKWNDQDEKKFQAQQEAFKLKDFNTNKLAEQNVQQTYKDYYNQDVFTPVQTYYNNMKKGVTDPEKLRKIDAQEARAMGGAAGNQIAHLEGELSRTSDEQKKRAIQSNINDLYDKQKQFSYNIDIPNATIAGAKGGGGKGSKGAKGAGTATDPLRRYRDKFSNAFVQSADLQHQLDDLTNGTSTEFDAEAARAEGEKIAAQQKDAQSLKNLTDQEKTHQEELKKSIKVQQAIIDVTGKRAETDKTISAGLFQLEHLYPSVAEQVDAYRISLQNEYKEQLRIADARYKSGKATAAEIKQYIDLHQAIDNATRAKKAEILVDAANDAKKANEDYNSSLRSPLQNQRYQTGLDLEKYTDLLNQAVALKNQETLIDKKLIQAQIDYNQALDAEKAAEDKGDSKGVEDAKLRVQLTRDAVDAYKTEKEAATASIPVFQERIRQLKEEDAIRKKWNGMGGPLFDWAKKASDDFTDLGSSMGNVLTGAMDDFVNSLADGKMAFADFAKTVLKQLLLIIIRGLIAKAIMSALGLATGGGNYVGGSSPDAIPDVSGQFLADTGGLGGGFSIGGGHTGMVAGGTPRFYRSVDPMMFAFANRYHTGGIVGLRKDEVPIIAQEGEGVFTKEQMKAMGQNKGSSNVQVNVINQTGVEADVERKPPRFDGEKWVEQIILKKMAKPGPLRDGLNAMISRK